MGGLGEIKIDRRDGEMKKKEDRREDRRRFDVRLIFFTAESNLSFLVRLFARISQPARTLGSRIGGGEREGRAETR